MIPKKLQKWSPKRAKMTSKLDFKMKRKIKWVIIRSSWKYHKKARCRNRENDTPVWALWSFTQIGWFRKDIRRCPNKSLERCWYRSQNHLKIHKINPKRMRKYNKNQPRHHKSSKFGSHVGASCLIDSQSGAFCLRPILQNLCGAPLGPMLAFPEESVVQLFSLFEWIYKCQRFQGTNCTLTVRTQTNSTAQIN